MPLYNDEEIDNRAVINILKQNMIEQNIRDKEIIDILKSQIGFLKDELMNKNEVIDKLLKSEITEEKNNIIDKLFTLIPSQKCTCRLEETITETSHSSEITSAHRRIPLCNLNNTHGEDNFNNKIYSWITSNDCSNYYDTSSNDDCSVNEYANDSNDNTKTYYGE